MGLESATGEGVQEMVVVMMTIEVDEDECECGVGKKWNDECSSLSMHLEQVRVLGRMVPEGAHVVFDTSESTSPALTPQDILSASTALLAQFSSAISQYTAHSHTIRDTLKSIRSREEALDELKRRRRTVHRKGEDADKNLSKMSPEHKNLEAQTELLYRLQVDCPRSGSEKLWFKPGSDPKVRGSGLAILGNCRTSNLNFSCNKIIIKVAVVE
jgi:hypothetical protein